MNGNDEWIQCYSATDEPPSGACGREICVLSASRSKLIQEETDLTTETDVEDDSEICLKKLEQQCSRVKQKTFPHGRSLQRHIRIHNGDNVYKCPNCGDAFWCKDDVINHQWSHSLTNALINHDSVVNFEIVKNGSTNTKNIMTVPLLRRPAYADGSHDSCKEATETTDVFDIRFNLSDKVVEQKIFIDSCDALLNHVLQTSRWKVLF